MSTSSMNPVCTVTDHATTARRAMAIVIALAAVGLARSVAAQNLASAERNPERDRAAVLALEHEWIAASDSATLDRILAPDFRHPVQTGDVLTKSQHIAWTTAHPLPKFLHPRFASLDVRVFGDAAVANGSVVTTDSVGREVDRNVFTDVFLFRNGRWQAVNAQETEVVSGPPRKR